MCNCYQCNTDPKWAEQFYNEQRELSWHKRHIELAEFISKCSKDRSTKVGAVIVDPKSQHIVSTGYNGFPRDVNDDIDERHDRPDKYMWTEHGERNALYNALRSGAKVDGCYLYLNFYPLPCADCTRGIIQSGIIKVIGPNRPFTGKKDVWDKQMEVSQVMLKEAGVEIEVIEMEV